MEISFPRIQTCHGGNSHISFPAIRQGDTIVCIITVEALRDHFYYNGTITQETIVEGFFANRDKVEEIAEYLIKQEGFEKDLVIKIESSTCQAYLGNAPASTLEAGGESVSL